MLRWFHSYLSDRTKFVKMNGASSDHHILQLGVTQGSVLGPLLCFPSRYYVSTGDINRSHDLNFHLYIDDMQHYIPLKSSSPFDRDSSISR